VVFGGILVGNQFQGFIWVGGEAGSDSGGGASGGKTMGTGDVTLSQCEVFAEVGWRGRKRRNRNVHH